MKKLSAIIGALSAMFFSAGACAADIGPVLNAGVTLKPGDVMISKNLVYELAMQADDGNLVLRKRSYMEHLGGVGGPIIFHKNPTSNDFSGWNTGRTIGGAYATMQADGNFVVYGRYMSSFSFIVPRWRANGGNKPADPTYKLVLGEDGSLTIQSGWGTIVQTLHTDTSSSTDFNKYLYPVCRSGGYSDMVLAAGGQLAIFYAAQKGGVLCPNGWPEGTFPGRN